MIPSFIKQLRRGDKILIESQVYGTVEGTVQSQDQFNNCIDILGDFGESGEFGSQITLESFYYDDYGKGWKAYEVVSNSP